MTELFDKLDAIGAETDSALEHFMDDDEMYTKYLLAFPDEPSMSKLVEAMNARDYDTAEKAVHALKGVTANLALINIMDCAMDVLADIREGDTDAAQDDFPALQKEYAKTVDVIRAWKETC